MSLQLISVTRRFGAQLALDSVSIHVRPGDCYGFIGHNGAGKTTAMRIALGLQRADSGQVLIDGFDARLEPREARARMGGLIEQPGFHGHLDGAKNLMLLARLAGMARPRARSETGRLLELVGLQNVGSKPVQAYSQGMRQRLGIAQAMIGNPKLVLLDEPTNGLDPQGIAEIRDILRRLVATEGVSVLLSSHQLHEISDLCNRIGVMHRGRLLVEALTKELLATAPGRFEIATNDDRAARELLAAEGLKSEPLEGGGLALDLGARAPGDIARKLVSGGFDLVRFGGRQPDLEEIYLRFARGEPLSAAIRTPHEAPPLVVAPTDRIAPRHPLGRVARYEWARTFAKPSFLALLALPAVVGVGAVLLEKRTALENAARVARGELASATDVTAFQTAASALQAGLPILVLLLAGLASQSLAGELSRGTLRNVLLRPQTRWQVSLGKALAGLCIALGAYALLVLAAVAASSFAFGFKDLVELLPNGEAFPLVAASELWPELRRALASQVAPLCGYYAVGFLAGAVARTAPGALGLAIGAVLAIDLGRGVARSFDADGWLLAAYTPSPLGDSSYVHFFADRAQGISNAAFRFAETWFVGISQEHALPLLWIAVALALSTFLLARRSMP